MADCTTTPTEPAQATVNPAREEPQMSTPITEPIVPATPTPPAAQPTPPAAPEAPAQETDWKAMARKWEANAKLNSSAAEKLAAIEESNKTEGQKLADRLAAAEAKATEYEAKALRAEVAQTKGVPAALLTGSTLDELTAAADALIAFRGDVPKLPAAPSAAGQGKVGDPVGAKASQLTEADLESMSPEQINEARRAGRLKTLLG